MRRQYRTYVIWGDPTSNFTVKGSQVLTTFARKALPGGPPTTGELATANLKVR